jgi:hypothetical protein
VGPRRPHGHPHGERDPQRDLDGLPHDHVDGHSDPHGNDRYPDPDRLAHALFHRDGVPHGDGDSDGDVHRDRDLHARHRLFRREPRVASRPVTLSWVTTAEMTRLHAKVFTSSFRLLKRFPIRKEDSPDLFKAGAHQLVWDGLDDRGRALVAGRYYLFLSAEKGN